MKEFIIDKDDYLEVDYKDNCYKVDFIHTDQHGLPLLMRSMEIPEHYIIDRCHGRKIPDRMPLYRIRYAKYIAGHVVKVMGFHPVVYKSYIKAVTKADYLTMKDEVHTTWLGKLINKIFRVKYKWIVDTIDWE